MYCLTGLHPRYIIAPVTKNAYAFGSGVKERTASFIKKYHFGFNDKENNGDISNDNYDFGARIYDARLGRWLAVDPYSSKYESISPYNFCNNIPIKFIDPNGKEIINPYKTITQSALAKFRDEDAKYHLAEEAYESALKAKKTRSMLSREEWAQQKQRLNEKHQNLINIKELRDNAKVYYEENKEKYEIVEKYLDDYFYYDPEGYYELRNLSIIVEGKNKTVNVYIEIDEKLSLAQEDYMKSNLPTTEIKSSDSKKRHIYGETEQNVTGFGNENASNFYAVPNAQNIPGVNGLVDNAIKIRINRDDDYYTLPHEKGHALFLAANAMKFYSFEEDYDAHSDNNPDGGAADASEDQYRKKRTTYGCDPRPSNFHRPQPNSQ